MLKKDVIRYFGSVAKAAAAIGYTRQAVYQWPRTVPLSAQYRVEVVTGGKFKAKRAA